MMSARTPHAYLALNNYNYLNNFLFRKHCRYHQECCIKSPTPDEVVFRDLATVYARNHPAMRTGNNCNETFPGGIVNGAYWYELNGKFRSFVFVLPV